MSANSGECFDESDEFYTLVPEQGLCLIGDTIINLRKVAVVRKQGGQTVVYYSGGQSVSLPGPVFDRIRDAVFSVDDFDDEEEEEIDED
jgi:hypothetical protein